MKQRHKIAIGLILLAIMATICIVSLYWDNDGDKTPGQRAFEVLDASDIVKNVSDFSAYKVTELSPNSNTNHEGNIEINLVNERGDITFSFNADNYPEYIRFFHRISNDIKRWASGAGQERITLFDKEANPTEYVYQVNQDGVTRAGGDDTKDIKKGSFTINYEVLYGSGFNETQKEFIMKAPKNTRKINLQHDKLMSDECIVVSVRNNDYSVSIRYFYPLAMNFNEIVFSNYVNLKDDSEEKMLLFELIRKVKSCSLPKAKIEYRKLIARISQYGDQQLFDMIFNADAMRLKTIEDENEALEMAYGIWCRALTGSGGQKHGEVYKIKSDRVLIYAYYFPYRSGSYSLMILRNTRLLKYGTVIIENKKLYQRKEQFLAGIFY